MEEMEAGNAVLERKVDALAKQHPQCFDEGDHHPAQPDPSPTISERLEEDQPGWDCRTMGNLVCGRTAAGP